LYDEWLIVVVPFSSSNDDDDDEDAANEVLQHGNEYRCIEKARFQVRSTSHEYH
jgi:hypothetical protein